jgi:predicted transposase/invertase (TIGR01784 family)
MESGEKQEKKKSRNLIRFDWALKRLLRNKANFEVLEGFISVLTGENLVIESIGESESNKLSPKDKYNRVDIFASNKGKEIFIIELQVSSEAEYFHRMLYGVSKAVVESVNEGDEYSGIKKVYHINIVYFELGQGEDYVYHGRNDFYGIHLNDVLKLSENQKEKYLKITDRTGEAKAGDIFPEYYILRVNDFDGVARNSLDEWIYYLKNDEIPEEFTAPGLAVVREKLLYDRLSTEEKEEYDFYRRQMRYDKSTITTALEEGRMEGRLELKKELEEKDKMIEEKDKVIEEKDAVIARERAEKEVILSEIAALKSRKS